MIKLTTSQIIIIFSVIVVISLILYYTVNKSDSELFKITSPCTDEPGIANSAERCKAKNCPQFPSGKKIYCDGSYCYYDRGLPNLVSCGKHAGKQLVQRGALCYEAPKDDEDWTTAGGILIGKRCGNKKDSGSTCWYDRGAGTPAYTTTKRDGYYKGTKIPKYKTSTYCHDGKQLSGAMCYQHCDDGYTGRASICSKEKKIHQGINHGIPDHCGGEKTHKIANKCYEEPVKGWECNSTQICNRGYNGLCDPSSFDTFPHCSLPNVCDSLFLSTASGVSCKHGACCNQCDDTIAPPETTAPPTTTAPRFKKKKKRWW